MRTYVGKHNGFPDTGNEVIILSINGGFRQGATAHLVGQFTHNSNHVPKKTFMLKA